LAAYRPEQGVYARFVAGAAALLLALFASVRVYQELYEAESTVALFGADVPVSAVWASVLFIILAALTFVFTYGVHTGFKALDRTSRALIDLLIDTQMELSKVSWPGSDVLIRSTSAVLISIVLLGVFLVGVDSLVASALRFLGVLP